MVGEHLLGVAPLPVAADGARVIHARLAAKAITSCSRATARSATEPQAARINPRPGLPLLFMYRRQFHFSSDVRMARRTSRSRCCCRECRVDDIVALEVVRQVLGVVVEREGELQDLHAGKAEPVAQRIDLGRDDAQVLGDDGQLTQRLFDGLE